MRNELQSTLFFCGTYDPTRTYSDGDVVFLDGDTLVWINGAFEPIGCPSSETKEDEKPMKKLQCPCCGAPLIRVGTEYKCEYCGMIYGV